MKFTVYCATADKFFGRDNGDGWSSWCGEKHAVQFDTREDAERECERLIATGSERYFGGPLTIMETTKYGTDSGVGTEKMEWLKCQGCSNARG